MIGRLTVRSRVARAGVMLSLLLFSLAGCPCDDKDSPTSPSSGSFPPLRTVVQSISAASGDTLETYPIRRPHLRYRIALPPGSLSADAVVMVGSPEDSPPNPCVTLLQQASSLLEVDTGGATLIDTCFVLIPYRGYDATNPPLPISFDVEGGPLDVLDPLPDADVVTMAVSPAGQRSLILALYDYMSPDLPLTHLEVGQDGAFDFESAEPVVLLVHGGFGSPSDFQTGPEPTLHDFLHNAYGGRVWTWRYWSGRPLDETGAALASAVETLESEQGAFPFRIDVVAHGVGGLVARCFVRNGGGRFVGRVVFLGTPNGGTTKQAWLWHCCHDLERDESDWINPNSPGFLDCVDGSPFLASLNTALSLDGTVHYFTIAGSCTPENPHAPGPDDHFISTSSVDLQLTPHEYAVPHLQREIALRHGQLVQNWNDGGADPGGAIGELFTMVGEDLGIVVDESGTIVIDPDPDHLGAYWELGGQQAYSGHGDETLVNMPPGEYTLTWGDASGYTTPDSQVATLGAGETLAFAVMYVEEGGFEFPEMIVVPSGAFIMGDLEAASAYEHRVTLTRDFYLGRYEVTNQEYMEALQWAYDHGYASATTTKARDNMDGSGVTLLDLGSQWCEIEFDGIGTFSIRDVGHGFNPDHPVKEVTWYGAVRYCDWLSLKAGLPRAYEVVTEWSCNGDDPYGAEGYRLPTDAEWEYAAQYNDDRSFPWGEAAPNGDLVVAADPHSDWTAPVGSRPDGNAALGFSDMAGNVSEWCNDRWMYNLGTSPVVDPVGPSIGSYRISRNGDWDDCTWWPTVFRCASRYRVYPSTCSTRLGFRVARTVNP